MGYISIIDISLIKTMLISRIGWKRAGILYFNDFTGTRFLTRGIDDSGNVANFVEVL